MPSQHFLLKHLPKVRLYEISADQIVIFYPVVDEQFESVSRDLLIQKELLFDRFRKAILKESMVSFHL